MHIAVLMGSNSSERAISLETGAAVAQALTAAGHEATEVVIGRVAEVLTDATLRQVDLVFPALHGGDGEDGHLQALLDLLEIPYALSGPLASALAMDKSATKRMLCGAGIPTPDWLQVTWDTAQQRSRTLSNGSPELDSGGDLSLNHITQRVVDELGFPVVIKPNSGGSSVGVEIVEQQRDFAAAFERIGAGAERPVLDIVLEKYIAGRELTAAIFLGRRLPLLEIRPRNGFYDYQNKYTEGANEYLVPAPVHTPLYEKISDDALRAFELLGCAGAARVDFRLDGENYQCLEINTIPGMTANSLVPKAAAAVGISFATLVDDLCRDALRRAGRPAPEPA